MTVESSFYKFTISIEGLSPALAVENFYLEEGISRPFSLNANLVSEDAIPVDNALAKPICLTIHGDAVARYVHGVISSFSYTGEVGRFFTYRVDFVPAIGLLGLNSDCRTFHKMSVPQIVTEVLKKSGYSMNFEFRLCEEYSPRRYCVQYGESDLLFISRILADEGIFYFFEHSEDAHKIIFADSNIEYQRLPEEADVALDGALGLVPVEEAIEGLTYSRSVCPGKVVLSGFNFKRPTLDMEVEDEGLTRYEIEEYQYPGDYAVPAAGRKKAKLRLQEKRLFEWSAQGTSNIARFLPGSLFSLSCHPANELNQEYCLINVAHSGSQSNVFGEYSGIGGDYSYSNTFLAIPASVTFRPEQVLDKPRAKGLQTAIVVGPPGEEIYADEYGRVKVQFHWDREGTRDENSSCWLRVSQPWSGFSWGFAALPRIGDEVLVDFLNGDPDWPIIVGSLNNAASPALYPLPEERARSGLRTRSYPGGGSDNCHELRFDDRRGREEIYLQSERDWNILVKNEKTETVGSSAHQEVGTDKTTRAGRTLRLEAGEEIEIVCGAASIRLDSSGQITLNGTSLDIAGSQHIKLASTKIDLN